MEPIEFILHRTVENLKSSVSLGQDIPRGTIRNLSLYPSSLKFNPPFIPFTTFPSKTQGPPLGLSNMHDPQSQQKIATNQT